MIAYIPVENINVLTSRICFATFIPWLKELGHCFLTSPSRMCQSCRAEVWELFFFTSCGHHMSQASHVTLYGASRPFDHRFSVLPHVQCTPAVCVPPLFCVKGTEPQEQSVSCLLCLHAVSTVPTLTTVMGSFRPLVSMPSFSWPCLMARWVPAGSQPWHAMLSILHLCLEGGWAVSVLFSAFTAPHQLWPCTGLAYLNGYWHSCFRHQAFAAFY